MLRRLLAVGVALVALAALPACSAASASPSCKGHPHAAPAKVPESIVPAALGEGTLSITEDTKARKRFAVAGSKSLVSEGRLYTIRQGTTLVGALQIATVKPKLNLSCEKDRKSVTSNLLPGSKQTINIAHTDVITSDANDKTLFVWFDRELFEVLQLKGSRIDPDAIINELVTFQTEQRAWKPLPKSSTPN
jgi:hypothetical protein